MFTTNFCTSQGATTEMSAETQTGTQVHKVAPVMDSIGTATTLPTTPSTASTVVKMGPETGYKPSPPPVVHIELASNQSDLVAPGRAVEV